MRRMHCVLFIAAALGFLNGPIDLRMTERVQSIAGFHLGLAEIRQGRSVWCGLGGTGVAGMNRTLDPN